MSLGNVERLDEFLRSMDQGGDREIRLALSRLHVDLKSRCEAGSPLSRDVFSAVLRTLPRIKGPKHSIIRMECLKQCAQYLYANGFAEEALVAVNQLRALSHLAQSKYWIRLAENVSGIVQADLGNVADAVTHYAKALHLARELEDVYAEVCTLVNLGVALNYSGLYREAIPCFTTAEDLARRNSATRSLEPTAAVNLAQSYLFLEQYRNGLTAITRALSKSTEPRSAEAALARTIRESTFVQIALELQEFDKARKHSTLCRNFANQSRTERGMFTAEVTNSLCEIYCGNIDKGLRELERTVEAGFNNKASYIDALVILVKAYDKAGRLTEASECMSRLLQYIRSVRENSALALLSASAYTGNVEMLEAEHGDLAALHCKEALLRARVAESDLFNSQIEMLERLAIAADLKEEVSGQHGYRVGRLASSFAKALGWDPAACSVLGIAGRLHDIGKIGVPDRILLASEELRCTQRQFMSAHTAIGAELLSKGNNAQLRIAEEVACSHHEWWNGQGYPSKLSGKRIPLHARVVALADVFDALTHGRPYADPWPIDAALDEIAKRKGTQFDPDLTDAFLVLISKLQGGNVSLEAYLAKGADNSPFARARLKIRQMLATERDREQRGVAEVEGLD